MTMIITGQVSSMDGAMKHRQQSTWSSGLSCITK